MLIAKAISCEMYVHTTRKERWIESKCDQFDGMMNKTLPNG